MEKITKNMIQELKNNMETNGYAFFNKGAFYNKTNEICYIPENADSISEAYTYSDLVNIVKKWIFTDNAISYFNEAYEGNPPILDIKLIDEFVISLYENIEWEMPETYLANISY